MRQMNAFGKKALTGLALAASVFSCGVAYAAAGGTIADIKARGQLTVGTEAAYEPYEFVQNDKIVGYGKDILDYMVKKLGVKLNQLNQPFQGLLPGVLARKFDFVATSVGITKARAAKVAFTEPVGEVRSVLVVKKDNGAIKNDSDIVGKIVGTQMGSLAQPAIEDYNKELKKEGKKGYADLKLFQSYPDVSVALLNGTIDVGVLPSNVLTLEMKQKPDAYRIVGEVGERRLLAWVTNPKDPEIRAFINDTLNEMRANGTLAKLQEKWFGQTMDLPTKDYLPAGAL
ncbi:transporter substrate-binding domain-containing protein [Castellaniella sp. MT123]|uniref:transporter substrate-binding domain-containing protein n=1 Tax=Castellaniella sp. MT123 TaxID=3140381 RepID=UPI0031F33DD7|nr:transporter substrate-binding domain-containing protein [Castellaniella sp.]